MKKRCLECGCHMDDDHYGNICECCMDDRVPGEKPLNISAMCDEEYITKVVRRKGVLKECE